MDGESSGSCQPSCLMKRSGSDLKSPKHESALISFSGSAALAPTAAMQVWTAPGASEHELNGSSVAGTIRRSLSRKVAMRDTSTSRAPCVSVLCQEPSPTSSSVQSLPLQLWPEVSLATQTTRSVPQFMNRAIGAVFQQWRTLTLGWL